MRYFWTTCVILLFCALNMAFAQRLPRLIKWADNQHFVIQKEGEYLKVNAQNGKEESYELSEAPSLRNQLPAGVNSTFFNTSMSPSGKKMIINQNNDLFYFDDESEELRQLTANSDGEQNPTFSPDESHIAFTRNKNLYSKDLKTGLEKQLTTDGGGLIYNGFASWVYYEEILGRGSRYRAFYWSPDSKHIAFLRFDDAEVPEFPIYHNEGEDMSHGYLERTRYPKSGDPTPGVELGIAHLEDASLSWVKKDASLDYLAWVFWTPDSKQLLYQQMDRDQTILHLKAANPITGDSKIIHKEQQSTWLDFYNEINFLKDNDSFIVLSDRNKWKNIYMHTISSGKVSPITQMDWRVTSIDRVDEDNKRVFFAGTAGNGTQSHYFVVNFDGTGLKQLTKDPGTHRVNLSPDGSYFVDNFNSHKHPGKMMAGSTDDSKQKMLFEIEKNANEEAGITVEFFTVPSTDGFDLPAYWVLPANFDENKKYPIVFTIYGGPDAGTVYDRYRNFSTNFMTNNDIIVFAVDHRASGKFGKRGLDYMHRSLGKWEIHDYVETVKWLRKKSFIDETKVGITGGSYGGYMTALALTNAADYFTHGVSRAPVTDWRLYDNVYTERYMDTPQDNAEGYDAGSAVVHADKLKGELLLIHGTIDDNVHMQQTMQLISKLQDLGKDFELMVYPGNRHGIRGAKGRHAANLSNKFWTKHFVEDNKSSSVKP
ncbi:MAG: DPP IV N-terminal domain-containing protein [Bacteroidota bacterium]